MPGITLQNGLISYYGNPAGYTEKNKAVVDRIFQSDELSGWLRGRGLAAEWTDGRGLSPPRRSKTSASGSFARRLTCG